MKISMISKAIGREKLNVEVDPCIESICSRYVLDVVSRLLGCRSLLGYGLKEKEVKEYLYKLGFGCKG
jgi:hypothetical protein